MLTEEFNCVLGSYFMLCKSNTVALQFTKERTFLESSQMSVLSLNSQEYAPLLGHGFLDPATLDMDFLSSLQKTLSHTTKIF